MDLYRELIKENISYDLLLQENPYDDELIDGYADAGDADPMLSLLSRPDWFPSLPPMWENSRTGIHALLWPLRAMPGLERLLQSEYPTTSEVTLFAAYLPIRSASFAGINF